MRTELARLLSFGLTALVLAAPSFARFDDKEPPAPRRRPAVEATKKAEEPKAGPITAIVGAEIQTVTQGLIRRGTVLIQDGKILKVGQDVNVPDDAEIIDAKGKYLTPGFVALDMSRVGVGSSASGRENKVADALDPFDRNLKFALGAGITTGVAQISGPNTSRFRFESAEQPGEFVEVELEELEQIVRQGVLREEDLLHFAEHVDDAHDHDHPQEEAGLVSMFDPRFFSASDREIACEYCSATVIETLPEPLAPPSPAQPRPSDFALIKLTFGELDGMLVQENPFYGLNLSALVGPFNVYSWRENIKKTKAYLAELAKHEAAKDDDKDSRPPRKTVDDKLIQLVKKEIPLRVQASTAEQIRAQIALAKELDYDLVLDGVHEGWLVAEDIGEARVPVVITPRDRRRPNPGREDSSGSSIELSGTLQKAGVSFAVTPLGNSVSLGGIGGRDLTSIALEAAFAVRGGADEAAALAALTIVPARILGLEDRIGSIEEGKDADLLILDGSPLDYRTYVEQAFVNGKLRYDRAEDRVYPVFDRESL